MKEAKLRFSCTLSPMEDGRQAVVFVVEGFPDERRAHAYGDWLYELMHPRADEMAAKFLDPINPKELQ